MQEQAKSVARKTRFRPMSWALIGIAAVTLTVSACGHSRHKDWRGEGGASPERVTKAVDKIFSRVDASDDQKAKITTIANQAIAQLKPLRAEMRGTRQDALNLLAAENIDRSAIETLRADRMGKADQASTILSAAMADIAEVLTPEQRLIAKDKISDRMKRRWGRHSE
ncbi:MAG: Spy/CpxP family protein refolding chaperone [Burkholderiaceae bacterium]